MSLDRPYNTLVINTVGEPGSGKTTLSFWLSQALKKAGVSVEYIPELVKFECFDPAGQARVRSGRYDFRYLALQERLIHPLMGRVEVAINDGSYELFYFYAKKRMDAQSLARFRQRIEDLRARHPSGVEHWFVMPRRNHPYVEVGRNESEEEARQVRALMRQCLEEEFQVRIKPVDDDADRVLLLEAILRRVGQLRAEPSA